VVRLALGGRGKIESSPCPEAWKKSHWFKVAFSLGSETVNVPSLSSEDRARNDVVSSRSRARSWQAKKSRLTGVHEIEKNGLRLPESEVPIGVVNDGGDSAERGVRRKGQRPGSLLSPLLFLVEKASTYPLGLSAVKAAAFCSPVVKSRYLSDQRSDWVSPRRE
jgi:hypothetical protein